MRRAAWLLVALAGCYAPARRAVDCGNGSYCPAGTRCLPAGGCMRDNSACSPGTCNIDGNCVAPPNTIDACGPTCDPCVPPAGMRATGCANGACQYQCKPKFCPSSTGMSCFDPTRTDDDANCGVCGNACDGTTCKMGLCQPKALVNNGRPTGLAMSADQTTLYWTDDSQGGGIGRMSADGTNVSIIVPQRDYPFSIAVDDQGIYWTEGMSSGTVMMAGLDGSLATPVASMPQMSPYGIAVDAGFVYWTDDAAGLVQRAQAANPLVTNAVGVSQQQPHGVAVRLGTVYWATAGDGAIHFAPAAGGMAPQVFIPGQMQPEYLAFHGSDLYWSNSTNNGSIVKKDAVALTSPVNIATGQNNPFAVAFDSDYVYWTNHGTVSGDASVMRVPLAGGTPQLVARDQTSASFLVVDASNVYWTNADATGAVLRAQKPPR
jgi:sugar lactone lactonase YvrE